MVHELSSCFGHFTVSVVHVCFLCICKGVCDYYRCIRQIFHNYWRREGRGRREGTLGGREGKGEGTLGEGEREGERLHV